MGVLLIIIGILLSADAAAVAVMLDASLGAAFIVGIFFILWGMGYKRLKSGNGFMKFLNVIFKLFFVYLIGMSCFLAVFGMFSDTDYNEDYAVVLGSAVRNSKPGPALRARLDTAADYCGENTDAVIVVSGGKGWDENVSEASVMRDYLISRGIEPDRIIAEDESSSTYENFKLSDALTGGAMRRSGVVAVTNDFHAFRAKLYARLCGIYTHTLSAPTRPYLIPVSYVRECLAMVKMLVYYLPVHLG